jgi:autotransporter passenger strand-loop-strand repeat protein
MRRFLPFRWTRSSRRIEPSALACRFAVLIERGLTTRAPQRVRAICSGSPHEAASIRRGREDRMADTVISGGQTSSGNTVSAGDTLTVLFGGTAISSFVGSQGTLNDAGLTTGTNLVSGNEIVSPGGVASGTTDDGFQLISAGGTAVGTIVESGGLQDVFSGTATGTQF